MSLKYFPLEYATTPQLLLKPLNLSNWIEIDENWSQDLDQKKTILRDHETTVLQYMPTAVAAVFELRDVLATFLSKAYPEKYIYSKQSLQLRETVFAQPSLPLDVLRQISVWTQEDWILLSPTPPVLVQAGTVCFPSRWSLAEKIGKDSDQVHGHVPTFSTIAAPTKNFIERLSIDKPMWRINWTIHDSNNLFSPGSQAGRTDLIPENVFAKTWLRVERQTFRRLPITGAVAFSIRTYITAMREVVADTIRAQTMSETLAGLAEQTIIYKGMQGFYPALQDALTYRLSEG